jgi:hypothetical protein
MQKPVICPIPTQSDHAATEAGAATKMSGQDRIGGPMPAVAEGVPELMRRDFRVASLFGPPDQHLAQAGIAEPATAAGAEPAPVAVGLAVRTPRAEVDSQGSCAGRGEGDQAAFAAGSGALERDKADERVLDHVGGQAVHDHAEQFLSADALAAENPDDGVVPCRLEVARPAVPGYLEQVIDEVGG